MGNTLPPIFIDEKSQNAVESSNIFAELVPRPMNLPPLKLVINDQIAISASDSLKDSQRIVDSLAKSMTLELFGDENRENFGTMLRHILNLNYTQEPIREMVLWSLKNANLQRSFSHLCKTNALYKLQSVGDSPQVFHQIETILSDQGASLLRLNIIWLLKHESMTVIPLANLAVEILPSHKVTSTADI